MGQKTTTDLALLPAEERALELRGITAESGKKGEVALMKLAEAEGDPSAISVLLRLNPLELALLIKSGDVTIPTMTAILANPKQIAELLAMDPAAWQKELNKANLFELQRDAISLISQILVNTLDRNKQLEILNAICADENAFFYLCFPFIGIDTTADEKKGVKGIFRLSRKEENEIIKAKNKAEAESRQEDDSEGKAESIFDEADDDDDDDDGETEEVEIGEYQTPVIDTADFQNRKDLLELIQDISPEIFEKMVEFLDEREAFADSWDGVILQVKDLRANAQNLLGENEDTEEYTAMFDKKK